MKINKTGQCYVRVRNNEFHNILLSKNDLIMYPETSMRFLDTVSYLPYVQSILTENPYLISCYDRNNVWVLNAENKWVNPDIQTFGASISYITQEILNYGHEIPLLPLEFIKALTDTASHLLFVATSEGGVSPLIKDKISVYNAYDNIKEFKKVHKII